MIEIHVENLILMPTCFLGCSYMYMYMVSNPLVKSIVLQIKALVMINAFYYYNTAEHYLGGVQQATVQ